MRMFITLTFSVHNTYFNTLIKIQQYKPSWGFGKLSLSLLKQLKNILVSCADASHPPHAKVNFMSKSQAQMQLIAPLSFICMYVAY